MTGFVAWLVFIVGAGMFALGFVLLVGAHRMAKDAEAALSSSVVALDAAMRRARENQRMLDEMLAWAKLLEQNEFGVGLRVMSQAREKRASS